MKLTKTAVSCAVATALGGASAVQAADIEFMTIQDVTGDGISGGFAFAAPGSTAYTNFFDSTSDVTFSVLFAGTFTVSPANPMGIIADGVGDGPTAFAGVPAGFTAGFLFTGNPFIPGSLNGVGGAGNTVTTPDGIDGTVSSAETALTMSEFYWGGAFGTSYFPLHPGGTSVANGDGLGTSFTSNMAWQSDAIGTACAIGSADVCYQLQWDAFILPQDNFAGDTVWQLEGVAKLDGLVTLADLPGAIPVPAAVWLFGSGLLGLVGVARRKKA